MKKPIFVPLFLIFYSLPAFSQYADLGTGLLKNQIWWLDWAGFTVKEGASKTFNTNAGLTVQVSFSNVSSRVPTPAPMNDYFGAILHILYDFSDPPIRPALFDSNATGTLNFTMTVSATRDGIPVSFYFITADAEASTVQEITNLQTNGGNWQTIQFFRNSGQTDDPLSGCGTQTVQISDTYGGSTQSGQNPVISTLSPATGPLVLPITFDHGPTLGGMALAFGILQSVDRGDLPPSYGTAQRQLLYNFLNSCNYNPPYPSLNQGQTLQIGSVPGDADPIQYTDDNAIGVDEEGISTFPAYDGSSTYSVNVTLGNTTGNNAFLTGWFDYNRNGVFEPGESITTTIPNNVTSAVLTWTGLPQYLPQGIATGYGFRFRISSDLQATQNATGYAPDGEVEDYLVPSTTLCTPLHPTVTPDQTTCAGQPVNLQAAGGNSYSWSPSAGLSDPSKDNPTASPVTTTLYTVTASNPQGCSANATMTVFIKPAPVITIDGQTTICQGKPVTLTASSGMDYSWTSNQGINASGPSLVDIPHSSAEYYVTGDGINGCPGTDSINITVQPVPVLAASAKQPSICKDDSIILTASGGDQYSWSSASGQLLGTAPSITVAPASTSTFQVQITNDLCELTQTLTVPVTVLDLPFIQITSSNPIDCTQGQATLYATGGLSYQWENSPGISDLTSANPIVRPTQDNTTYFVKATGSDGCSSTDSITIKADLTSDLSHYPVPSAFTPNNDGNNDCFGLKYWGNILSLELAVFNRWGQRVFFTSDPQQCWDGTYKGVAQPAGGYVYQIKAITACGMAYRKGTVMLIR